MQVNRAFTREAQSYPHTRCRIYCRSMGQSKGYCPLLQNQRVHV